MRHPSASRRSSAMKKFEGRPTRIATSFYFRDIEISELLRLGDIDRELLRHRFAVLHGRPSSSTESLPGGGSGGSIEAPGGGVSMISGSPGGGTPRSTPLWINTLPPKPP